MIPREVYSDRTWLAALLVLMHFLQMNVQANADPQDNIPRNRLITNTEFADLLDSSFLPSGSASHNSLQRYLRHIQQRTVPQYFFARTDIRERISTFVKLYPDTVIAMKRDADEFIERFGYDVDWMRPGTDRKGTGHTPNTVRALARQRYAESIVLQYFFHNDTSAIQFWLNHVKDFASDVEAGRVERGGNDIFERFYAGHRLRNWLAVHFLLTGDKAYKDDDHVLVIKSLILNAANIYDQCKKFSYGNHQLVGAEALYEATIMFPEFSLLRMWNAQAKKIVLEHFDKEITGGGLQLERSSHYHKLDIVNYLRFYRLAVLNNDPLPASFGKKFKSMFTAMMQIAAPNKKLPFLQDVSDSVQARFDDIADEMGAGALLFNDSQFKYFSNERFPAGYFWYFPLREIERFSSIPAETPTIGSTRLDEGEYFVMRSGWDPGSHYLLIDGGRAVKKPDHTHGGVLGIVLMGNGELLLPNYPVRYSDPAYPVLKNSFAKNVAIVDSLPQARGWIGNAANTGFGKWNYLPTPVINKWEVTPEYDFFSASHNGFDTVGVEYSRSIFYRKGKYWIVVDDFKSSDVHRYQQIWQGNFKTDPQTGSVVCKAGDGSLHIYQVNDVNAVTAGTVAGYYPSVWFSTTVSGNFQFITVLYPRSKRDEAMPVIKSELVRGGKRISIAAGNVVETVVINSNAVTFATQRRKQ